MAPEATQYSEPQTLAELRLWCRQTRKGLRDAIDNYDEASLAGLYPTDVGPNPVAEAIRDAANYLADLGNFDLARQLTAATGRGVDHEEALSLFMHVEEWCIGDPPTAAPRQAPVTTQSESGPLATWKEKLEYLQQQEAVTADPAQKFALKKQIEEAQRKIGELG